MEKLLKDLFKTYEFELYQINDLAYYFRDYYKVNDYIKKIQFKSFDGDGLYNVEDKALYLDVNNILSSTYEEYKKYSDFYRIKLERFYLINIIITLLHEITHAKQAKIADEDINDTYHKIVKEGVDLGRRSPNNLTPDEKLLYKLSYSKVLSERNAMINSYYDLYLLNELDLLGEDELEYIIYRLNKYLSSGYYVYKTPASAYYSLRNKKDEYKKLDFNDKEYDLYTRLSWGFPVDRSIIKEKDKLKLLQRRKEL